MNIPQLKDIDIAIQIYYKYPEITAKEIQLLFVKNSKSTINKLKKLAQKQMIEDNINTLSLNKVNTSCAYKAWGIDIKDLENRRNKLKKLGL